MSMFSDMMPDFSDPNQMAIFGALGNALRVGATPRPITGMGAGNALAGLVGAGMEGASTGATASQGYKSADMTNQVRAAALPFQINMMKNMGSGAPGAMGGIGTPGGSPADAQFQQAYTMALASGDMKKVSDVLQSWAEHNPALAGAIKQQQEQNTFQKTPQGTYVMPGGGAAFGSPAPQMPAAQLTPPTGGATLTPVGNGPAVPPDIQAAIANSPAGKNMDNSSNPPPLDTGKIDAPPSVLSADGKPIIPDVKNLGLLKPDPSRMPRYNTDNTETGVDLTKKMQEADLKANSDMTGNLSSLKNERFRLQQLADVYKQTQSGTLLAAHPDVANYLASLGIVLKPGDTHDLAMIQKATANQAIQIIQQIKDANANLGGPPSRLFGSEIANLQEKAENAGSRPEANFEVITDAMGLANHAADMAKGWDAIGGLGNRLANGATLRPEDYARKFIESHDPQDYKQIAMKQIGAFKGMAASKIEPQKIVDELRKRGHKIQ